VPVFLQKVERQKGQQKGKRKWGIVDYRQIQRVRGVTRSRLKKASSLKSSFKNANLQK